MMRHCDQPARRRKHWLCVAYAFPPINRSGTHRTLGFVKHLDRLGWDATVLTVGPQDEPMDESLCDEVPASTTILRTHWIDVHGQIKRIVDSRSSMVDAGGQSWSRSIGIRHSTFDNPQSPVRNPQSNGLRDWASRLLITPDSRIGWITPAVRAGIRAIRRRRPDVIYSTSPYPSAHLIALILCRWARVPWVADFRDPWRGNPFRELGAPSLEGWDSFLEWLVLRSAAHVVVCTPTMADALCRRQPFVTGKCTTILNAFDPERFADLAPIRPAPPDHFVATHCGQFYGPRSPKVWFVAMRKVLDRMPELAGRVHIVLIGRESYEGRSLADWAYRAGIGECVQVLGPKTHTETLRHMAGSDALLLSGSAGAGAELQIPNKLFEYLAVRKPIIATCCAASPIVTILNDARAEAVICNPVDVEAHAGALAQLATHRHVPTKNAWSGVDRFERAHRAEELAVVFQRVSLPRTAQRNHVMEFASAPIRSPTTWPRERGPCHPPPAGSAPMTMDASDAVW
jgi:glycosyltransferase involved in cell wall biosynthesis